MAYILSEEMFPPQAAAKMKETRCRAGFGERSTLREIDANLGRALTLREAVSLLHEAMREREMSPAQPAAFAEISSALIGSAAAAEKTRSLALQDSLTGLFNMRAFRSALERRIAEGLRPQSDPAASSFYTLHLNINDFSAINERAGFFNGDLLLTQVAETLKAQLPDAFALARAQADLFLALLPFYSDEDVAQTIAALRRALEERTFTLDDKRSYQLTVSIGAVLFPADGDDADTLLVKSAVAAQRDRNARRRLAQSSPLKSSQIPSHIAARNVISIASRLPIQ